MFGNMLFQLSILKSYLHPCNFNITNLSEAASVRIYIRQLFSSEPSEQSASLSHAHFFGMHFLFLHVNSFGLQVARWQLTSSLPSPQSSSPSHFHLSGMHFWEEHLNLSSSQKNDVSDTVLAVTEKNVIV